MNYELIAGSEIPTYVSEQPSLKAWGAVLDVEEVSDGYLNNVFRVTCEAGSLILKQSMPYVRVDPTWPLTPTRIAQEARSYRVWNLVANGFAPQVHLFDEKRFVLVEEDLVGHVIWRDALNADRPFPEAAAELGKFIARVAVHANAAAVSELVEREKADELTGNPVMRRLMEEVVFEFPYSDHPHNSYPDAVSSQVVALRNDAVFRSEVEELQHTWLTHPEALIHGDLHTGSVMVAAGSARVIDAEFSFLGSVAWDLGQLLGNLLLALIRCDLLARSLTRAADMPLALFDSFADELQRIMPRNQEPEAFGASWMQQTISDAFGYAGLEMIRRIIGSGKAADLTTLPEDSFARGARVALDAGREIVLQRQNLTPAGCVAIVQRIGREEP